MSSIKNKRKKKAKTKTNGKFSVGYLFPIALLLYVLCVGGYKTYQSYILKKDGICINAIVYHRYHGFRTINTQYRFVWNNKTYEGISTNDADVRYLRKSVFKEDDVFVIGDTIVVVVLESNPNINRSNSIIKKFEKDIR